VGAEPLRIESIVDRVYAVVRDRILLGEIERGARLRQEALSAELGVSRTPLREALRRLAAEGLVELQPNRGARVADVRPEDMRCAYEARLVVEPGAARLAAERRDSVAIARMREAIRHHRSARGSVGRTFEANRDFHVALCAGAGNEHLTRFAEMLWVARIGVPIYERQQETPEQVAANVAAHSQIVDAIEAGDGDAAEHLTRAHIAGAMRDVLRAGEGAQNHRDRSV
jgi:DNA-binding GntR family transcriptional regulator